MSIDKNCSVYTGELLAIEKAIGYVIDNNWDVLILSDSQAAIKEIRNYKMSFYKSETTYKIRDRIKEYQELGRESGRRENRVVLDTGWVPSHSGVTGNEDADDIAKGVTLEEKEPCIKVPSSD